MEREQGVPVRGSLCDDVRANDATGSRPVVDDEVLLEPLRQSIGDDAPDDVHSSARRERNDDAYGVSGS